MMNVALDMSKFPLVTDKPAFLDAVKTASQRMLMVPVSVQEKEWTCIESSSFPQEEALEFANAIELIVTSLYRNNNWVNESDRDISTEFEPTIH